VGVVGAVLAGVRGDEGEPDRTAGVRLSVEQSCVWAGKVIVCTRGRG